MLFDGPFAHWLAEQRVLDKRRPVVPLDDHRPLLPAFEAIGEAPTHHRLGGVLAAEHLMTIIRAASSKAGDGNAPVSDPLVRRALRRLDAAKGPMSIESLAEELRVSSATLRRRFSDEIGTSPKRYLLGKLLARAQELLVTTALPVQDVASQVGFEDALYFSHLFRSHVGRSPAQFRDEHRR